MSIWRTKRGVPSNESIASANQRPDCYRWDTAIDQSRHHAKGARQYECGSEIVVGKRGA